MIAGHFGFAAAVKAKEPQLPMWVLMLATVWLDVIFVPLLLMKIETTSPVKGGMSGYGRVIIHADYTHSLVGALVLSVIFGVVGATIWGRRSGLILGLVVFSHWLLDLLFHRMDMPFLPANAGNLPRLGLGLWQYPILCLVIEFGLVVCGSWMFWSATKRLGPDEVTTKRARFASALILIGGVATLFLDFSGVLG